MKQHCVIVSNFTNECSRILYGLSSRGSNLIYTCTMIVNSAINHLCQGNDTGSCGPLVVYFFIDT